MSEEDLTNYKIYINNFDITKHVILDKESNYWYSAEYVDKMLKEKDKEIERLNKIRQQVIDELFELKDMIYKPKTREINFDVQRKISSMIVKLGSDKE